MLAPPLQVIDSFLLGYNVGDVLILVAVLGALGIFVQRSNQLLGLHFLSMGAIFLILPTGMFDPATNSVFGAAMTYKFVGIALLAIAPVLYAIARR